MRSRNYRNIPRSVSNRKGEWQYWDVHHLAEAIVEGFNQDPQIEARLLCGPDSRQYNNVAIVIDKAVS